MPWFIKRITLWSAPTRETSPANALNKGRRFLSPSRPKNRAKDQTKLTPAPYLCQNFTAPLPASFGFVMLQQSVRLLDILPKKKIDPEHDLLQNAGEPE